MDYERKYNEARSILQKWASGKGQDLCFWHPDVIGDMARLS